MLPPLSLEKFQCRIRVVSSGRSRQWGSGGVGTWPVEWKQPLPITTVEKMGATGGTMSGFWGVVFACVIRGLVEVDLS